jgi:alkanesulfonate monooxygenase SsuD/methylene tetrahydromethanopterin reductase-like flavin-dependent oxidoreductase (luciferase family)
MEKRVLASFGYRVETAHYQHVGVGERSVSRLLEAAENVPEEYVHKVAAIGGQNEVEEKIERLSKAGVRHFAMQGLLAPSEVKRNLTLFGKVVRRYR